MNWKPPNPFIYSENLTLICRFIVKTKSVMKYIKRIGQNTGILNASKNVQIIEMTFALVAEYQK